MTIQNDAYMSLSGTSSSHSIATFDCSISSPLCCRGSSVTVVDAAAETNDMPVKFTKMCD